MSIYTYRAVNQQGQEVHGTLRADTDERARTLLKENGLKAVFLQAHVSSSLLGVNIFNGFVSLRDLAVFSEQMSAMIKAGVPIVQALQALQQQTGKESFRRTIEAIKQDIDGGLSLSAAMSKHDKVFSPFFLGVVQTGEASGRLASGLESLSEHLNQDYDFIRRIRAALAYPILVITTIIVVTIIIFTMVLPQIVTLFQSVHAQLPLPTRILLGITTFLQNYWYVVLAVAVVGGFLFRSYFKTPEGKYTIASFLLRVPVLSTILQKVYLTRLTSMLHTLFSSHVPVVESFTLTRDAIGNKVYQRVLERTIMAIKDGAPVSGVWAQEPYIPPMLTSMVEVGEKSGRLEFSFEQAHLFFQRDVTAILNSVSTLLEPIMVILLGIGVGIIVTAVLLPIYSLVTVI